jgi:hypothetical protein
MSPVNKRPGEEPLQDVFVEGELGPGRQQAGLARPRDELFRCVAVLGDVARRTYLE